MYILFGEKNFYSLNLIPFRRIIIFSKTLIGQLEKKERTNIKLQRSIQSIF